MSSLYILLHISHSLGHTTANKFKYTANDTAECNGIKHFIPELYRQITSHKHTHQLDVFLCYIFHDFNRRLRFPFQSGLPVTFAAGSAENRGHFLNWDVHCVTSTNPRSRIDFGLTGDNRGYARLKNFFIEVFTLGLFSRVRYGIWIAKWV